jgi:hypothetical protein
MAKYYVFQPTTGSGRAITDDKLGAKLPKRQFGNWVFEKEIDLNPGENRMGLGADEIIAAVKKDGYILWPLPKEENVLASTDVLNTSFDLDAKKAK